MINYIIQVLLFQALFLAVYDFFLQKETFFKWNRVYLLVTPFLSFLIPLLKFETFQETVPQEYIVYLPEVILNPQVVIEQTVQNETTFNYLPIVFVAGAILFLGIFLTRIYKIIALINSNRIIKKANYKLVLLAQKQSAFSFFNYIFINNSLIENKELNVIQHELVHCKQNHSVDLLVFEFLKIVMWFNPLIYVYQKRITLLHEYIADSEVVKSTNKKTYFNQLLAETFNVENISFINHFFKQSLIKNRIAMITKNKSGKIKQLKYLLIIPLLLGMLIMSSFEEKDKEIKETFQENTFEFNETNSILLVPLETKTEISNHNTLASEKQLFVTKNKISIVKTISQPLKSIPNKTVQVKIDTVKPEIAAVPFALIENTPIFPGCEGTENELRQCLQERITDHVYANFNVDLTKSLGLSPGVKRIFVIFKIDKEGNIKDIDARGPHKALADEAMRVVNSLPQMKPGKQHGENVSVKYSLPIAVKVAGDANDKQNTEKKEQKKYVKGDPAPFAIVDNVPIYPGCEGTEKELRQCLLNKITGFVNENFDTSLKKSLNLKPGVKRIYVMFKIDKQGTITDVQARAAHKELQEEAIRVVNSLPEMIPGKFQGVKVDVKYSLPIAFNVE